MFQAILNFFKAAFTPRHKPAPKPQPVVLEGKPGMVVEGYKPGTEIVIKGYTYASPTLAGPWRRRGPLNKDNIAPGKFIEFVRDDVPWLNGFVRQADDGSYYGKDSVVADYNKLEGWPNAKDSWERVHYSDPYGTSKNDVWPAAHVVLKNLEGCIVTIERSDNAPAEIVHAQYCTDCVVKVEGYNANTVILHTNRGAVRDEYGNRNSYVLKVTSRGVALRVDHSKGAIKATGVAGACAALADIGAVNVLGRLDPGLVDISGLRLYQLVREYPLPVLGDGPDLWPTIGVYWDDFCSYNKVDRCEIEGFRMGVFVHGGSYNSMTNLTMKGVDMPIVYQAAPYRAEYIGLYPEKPTNNVYRNVTTDKVGQQILVISDKIA